MGGELGYGRDGMKAENFYPKIIIKMEKRMAPQKAIMKTEMFI